MPPLEGWWWWWLQCAGRLPQGTRLKLFLTASPHPPAKWPQSITVAPLAKCLEMQRTADAWHVVLRDSLALCNTFHIRCGAQHPLSITGLGVAARDACQHWSGVRTPQGWRPRR